MSNSGASADTTKSSPEQKVVRADDCQPGELRSGAGELWRVAIDPLRRREDKNRNYFVPVHTQLYIARKLEFNDPGRKYALPPNFQNKHKLLPQRRKAPPLPIRPLKEAQLAVSEKQLEELCDLKKKAKKYVDEKNAFLAAKAHYTQAKCRMESLMGIFTPEKISQMQENEKIVERQIAEADAKIDEFKKAKATNDASIEQADDSIRLQESNLAKAINAGDETNAKMLYNKQLQTFKGYKAKLEAYGTSLQKNLNLLDQAKTCLQKEQKKLHEKVQTAKETRMHYRGVEDLNHATIDVNECKNRLQYLQAKLEETNKNIDVCKNAKKPDNLDGGFVLQGGEDDVSYLHIDGANRAVKAVMDIDKTVNAEALKKKYKVCQDNLPKLEIQKGELKELIIEAERDLELAEKKLENVKNMQAEYCDKNDAIETGLLCSLDLHPPAKPAEPVCKMTIATEADKITFNGSAGSSTLTINKQNVIMDNTSNDQWMTNNGNKQNVNDVQTTQLYLHMVRQRENTGNYAITRLLGYFNPNQNQNQAWFFQEGIIMSEVGYFNDKKELQDGFRTFRSPQAYTYCVSQKICAGKINLVYTGECALGLVPHGHGYIQGKWQMLFKWDNGVQQVGDGKSQSNDIVGQDSMLKMVQDYSIWRKNNPDADDKEISNKRTAAAYNVNIPHKKGQIFNQILKGGKESAVDRLYASAQRMQVLAGGGRQTARQLAEAHLQAGVLVKDISEGLEQDRIRELQLRSGPGSLDLSGGSGGNLSQMAHNQQVLSDFRYAAIQTLRGGSHRKILGGELSDALIMHYSNPNPS